MNVRQSHHVQQLECTIAEIGELLKLDHDENAAGRVMLNPTEFAAIDRVYHTCRDIKTQIEENRRSRDEDIAPAYLTATE